MFPNPYSVFLHGMPATELFSRTRRDFSHGCIRIEDPTALADDDGRAHFLPDLYGHDARLRAALAR